MALDRHGQTTVDYVKALPLAQGMFAKSSALAEKPGPLQHEWAMQRDAWATWERAIMRDLAPARAAIEHEKQAGQASATTPVREIRALAQGVTAANFLHDRRKFEQLSAKAWAGDLQDVARAPVAVAAPRATPRATAMDTSRPVIDSDHVVWPPQRLPSPTPISPAARAAIERLQKAHGELKHLKAALMPVDGTRSRPLSTEIDKAHNALGQAVKAFERKDFSAVDLATNESLMHCAAAEDLAAVLAMRAEAAAKRSSPLNRFDRA
ncbi:hypothetical protein [Mitsuaria sp. GD03876]|uniref:hypothetical protein n=1 Tax=Mitsuaria sp. GD03876 TaxID=2975399 RepID=UPI0024492440|nr:hypothetical protein [Mitsuaria sp. GD03876]MDH0866092.1 hypothetical protein [Mitsuaria sp. GD03876]